MTKRPSDHTSRCLRADQRGEVGVGYLLVIALGLGVTVALHAAASPIHTAIDRVREMTVNDVP